MNTPAQLQADVLVQDIQGKADAQQLELLAAAGREADDIRRRARIKARRQLRRAIDEMRAMERQRLQQLRAELETRNRQQASRQATEALAVAWPRLATALERRWRDPAARRRWIDAQLAIAHARLPAQGWRITHPADLAAEDVALLSALGNAVLQPDASLTAGLVIEVGGARLDSRPEALLADRAQVESALLAAIGGL